MTRCAACRRSLTNPVSLKHGLGPDCLKRAVQAGTAPMEALGELVEWKRNRPKRTAQPKQAKTDNKSFDLFTVLRNEALADLRRAADNCLAYGVSVTIDNPFDGGSDTQPAVVNNTGSARFEAPHEKTPAKARTTYSTERVSK